MRIQITGIKSARVKQLDKSRVIEFTVNTVNFEDKVTYQIFLNPNYYAWFEEAINKLEELFIDCTGLRKEHLLSNSAVLLNQLRARTIKFENKPREVVLDEVKWVSPRTSNPVSYTHLTLPTILRV